MRIPMPKLKEKNACPIARTMTWGVIFEKSGCRKNFSPSLASGSVNDRMQKTMRIMNSIGINMLDIFSIPFCTPLDICLLYTSPSPRDS